MDFHTNKVRRAVALTGHRLNRASAPKTGIGSKEIAMRTKRFGRMLPAIFSGSVALIGAAFMGTAFLNMSVEAVHAQAVNPVPPPPPPTLNPSPNNTTVPQPSETPALPQTPSAVPGSETPAPSNPSATTPSQQPSPTAASKPKKARTKVHVRRHAVLHHPGYWSGFNRYWGAIHGTTLQRHYFAGHDWANGPSPNRCVWWRQWDGYWVRTCN
jgi:hypothetical protein